MEGLNKQLYTSTWVLVPSILWAQCMINERETCLQQNIGTQCGSHGSKTLWASSNTTAHTQQPSLLASSGQPYNHITQSQLKSIMLSHKTSSNWSTLSQLANCMTVQQLWNHQWATSTWTYNTDDQEGTGEEDCAQKETLEECRYLSKAGGGGVPLQWSEKEKLTSWESRVSLAWGKWPQTPKEA